jgi:hypothetical protein
MPAIHRIELERVDNSGTEAPKGNGTGEIPVDDPNPLDHPEVETEAEREARDSEAALDRAIVRLPPG